MTTEIVAAVVGAIAGVATAVLAGWAYTETQQRTGSPAAQVRSHAEPNLTTTGTRWAAQRPGAASPKRRRRRPFNSPDSASR
jgi:hypothetical protein